MRCCRPVIEQLNSKKGRGIPRPFYGCRKILWIFPTKGLQSAARIILSLWLIIPLLLAWAVFFPRSCLRWGTFCQQRQKVPKERRQSQGFEIHSAAEVPTALFPIHHANRSAQNSCLAFASSLHLIPRRAPRLCCPGLTGKAFASAVRCDVGIAPCTKSEVLP